MRLVIALAALALTVAPVAAQPVATAQLAPGEVLLELSATGSVRARADSATIIAVARGEGATEAEADAARDAVVARITAAARAAGVPEDGIRVISGESLADAPAPTPALVELAVADMQAAAEDMERPDVKTARSVLEIRTRNIDGVAALRQAIEAAGANQVAPTSYQLGDTNAARRQAGAEALARARADADAYAAALGMRVVRIVRVTERLGLDLVGVLITEPQLMRAFMASRGSPEPETEVRVILGVDFVLAPR